MRITKTLQLAICISTNVFGATSNQTPSSDSDHACYRNCCQKAAEDDLFFAGFKRNSDYTPILEHVSENLGQDYLSIIKKQSPEFIENIELFQKNDLLGSPNTGIYAEIGAISPTTLRYMKVASDLQLLFGSSLEQKSIVEIGGGYGGQCLILSMVYKFKDYTIIDLPEPLALTKKYLEKHNIHNVIYKSFDEEMYTDELKNREFSYDLVISNYAYHECSDQMREKYLKDILSRSQRGYLTGSKHWMHTLNYLRSCNFSLEMKDENPLTGSGNLLLTWK